MRPLEAKTCTVCGHVSTALGGCAMTKRRVEGTNISITICGCCLAKDKR